MLGDGVPGHAAVPEQIRGLGRDDVRRVGDDEVELLTLDRFEEAACSCLDVADAVERRVERCVGERPLVHVRRDHALGVRGEQNCLDPVAGAQVEGALALAAHGQVGESDGRTMHARHVVGVRLSGARMIRGDEQLVVRDEACRPVDDLCVLHEQPSSREARPQLRADELVEARARDGNAEHEQSEEHGQLVRVAEPPQVRRELGRASEELVARREPLLDAVRLVAGVPQQPGELDRCSRALRARRVGAPGRGYGADWLHGWALGRVGPRRSCSPSGRT